MDIKTKLQKLFDEDITCIKEKDGLYYLTLDDRMFIKPIYEVDLNSNIITEKGIPAPVFEKEYKHIWSRSDKV